MASHGFRFGCRVRALRWKASDDGREEEIRHLRLELVPAREGPFYKLGLWHRRASKRSVD